jgi:hypothetical protein
MRYEPTKSSHCSKDGYFYDVLVLNGHVPGCPGSTSSVFIDEGTGCISWVIHEADSHRKGGWYVRFEDLEKAIKVYAEPGRIFWLRQGKRRSDYRDWLDDYE